MSAHPEFLEVRRSEFGQLPQSSMAYRWLDHARRPGRNPRLINFQLFSELQLDDLARPQCQIGQLGILRIAGDKEANQRSADDTGHTSGFSADQAAGGRA